MTERTLLSPHDQSATFVELFFDLVFVFGITQVVGLLHGSLDWAHAGQALLVFWMIWWAWTQYTWAFNAADTTHPIIQFGGMVATAVAFFMAVGVPGAFGEDAIWFALPYLGVRILGLSLYMWVMWESESARQAVGLFAAASLGGIVAVVLGVFVPESRVIFWGFAIFLDVLAALIGGQRSGWNLHPEHFAERHGLIVIIALGEGLIVAAGGLVGADRSPEILMVGFLAVAITCGLWWSYFPVAMPELERALTDASEETQGKIARDSYSLGHFPMLCGVIAYAIAIEESILHPGEPLPVEVRAALSLGLLLFVGGLAFAMFRASCTAKWGRLVVSFVTAAAVFFLADLSAPQSLGVALLGVVVVGALEERQAQRHRAAA